MDLDLFAVDETVWCADRFTDVALEPVENIPELDSKICRQDLDLFVEPIKQARSNKSLANKVAKDCIKQEVAANEGTDYDAAEILNDVMSDEMKKKQRGRKKVQTCDQCGESCKTIKELRKHMTEQHNSISLVAIPTGGGSKVKGLPPIYACHECDRCFAWPSHLERHMKIHSGDKPYSCYVCSRTFAQSGNLNMHVRTHTGERPYTCDVCGKRFSRVDNLNTHRRAHTGERPYPCEICNRSFVMPQQHAAHMRHHAGEKPYKCAECGRLFAVAAGLSKHMTLHFDSRPYVCSECGERFSEEVAMRDHWILHCGTEMHVCMVCEKVFQYQRTARMHLRNHLFRTQPSMETLLFYY